MYRKKNLVYIDITASSECKTFFFREYYGHFIRSRVWRIGLSNIEAVIQNSHSQLFDRKQFACLVRSLNKAALEYFLEDDISTSIRQSFIFSLKIYSTPLSSF